MRILLDQWKDRAKVASVNESRLDTVLQPLEQLAQTSSFLIASPLELTGNASTPGVVLPRYLFLGPKGGGDAIRIGVFAGIHGDEPAGSLAVARFAEQLESKPDLARGYHVFLYPICNPSGFIDGTRLARSGKDLNREFWQKSTEPEVVLLEREIRSQRFHGLVSLHADDTSDGLYGFVRGAVLTRDLLVPALRSAEQFLPRNMNSVIDGFAATNGIISECYDGILTSPPELDPTPFEIILETPHAAPLQKQVDAFVAALERILVEYQRVLSFAANL